MAVDFLSFGAGGLYKVSLGPERSTSATEETPVLDVSKCTEELRVKTRSLYFWGPENRLEKQHVEMPGF